MDMPFFRVFRRFVRLVAVVAPPSDRLLWIS